ncbi:hypothetical protein QUA89_30535 [Microcoleus sp. F10-B4]|uniref:hypothetical protein n=1 Tax=unclassified Microcoleus TaxID=2642155 RepID=UPI002FD2A05C
MGDYINLVNQEFKKSEWLIICELFAPNAPEQNPVADILADRQNISEFKLVSM